MNKKIALTSLIMLSAMVTSAQTPTSASLEPEAKSETAEKTFYIELLATMTHMGSTSSVTVEFGSLLPSALGIKDTDLQMIQRSMKFKSAVDGINYWAAKGWTVVDTYNINTAANKTITHIILGIKGDPKDVMRTIITR